MSEMTSGMRLVFNVFKLRIGLVIAVTALTGMAIQPGAALDSWQVAVLFLAVLVSSASAGAFNHTTRPTSTGRCSARASGRSSAAGWRIIAAGRC
ncbi:MAG: hypothetical protein WCA12_04830 [Burkholderiales bacterium]